MTKESASSVFSAVWELTAGAPSGIVSIARSFLNWTVWAFIDSEGKLFWSSCGRVYVGMREEGVKAVILAFGGRICNEWLEGVSSEVFTLGEEVSGAHE